MLVFTCTQAKTRSLQVLLQQTIPRGTLLNAEADVNRTIFRVSAFFGRHLNKFAIGGTLTKPAPAP